MSGILTAALLLPALTGAALLLAGHAAHRRASLVSVIVTAATLLLSISAAIARPALAVPFIEGGSFALRVDGLSAVLLPVVVGIALLVLLFAAAERTGPAGRFHGLILLFIAAVIGTVTAASLPALLAAWEVMGATSYALIGFIWQERTKVEGGFVAFVVTRSADLGLYLAAGAAVAGGAGLSLDGLRTASGPWLHVVAAGVLVAGLGKAAQLPFSFWLSRAMEGPSAVSALLHSAAMVAMGGYLLLRTAPLLATTGWAATVAAWVGASTAVLLGGVAIAQRDLKQVLAASTASQLGFVVLAAGLAAVTGGTEQLLAHAATKALLFLCAGVWLAALGTKQLPALQGVARRWRTVGVLFTIGAATLAGLPPLALWLTKDTVLAAALQRNPALYGVGLVAAVLSAGYAGRILTIVWRRPRGTEATGFDTDEQGSRTVPVAAVIPLGVLAVAAIASSLLAVPPLVGDLRQVLGAGSESTPSAPELVVSAVLALVAAAAAARLARPEPRRSIGWLGLERAAQVLVGDSVQTTARQLARFDDLLESGLRTIAAGILRAAQLASTFDERGIAAAMNAVARGTGAAGRRARRLQTGSLYQYYAAAVIATAALTVLLIVAR